MNAARESPGGGRWRVGRVCGAGLRRRALLLKPLKDIDKKTSGLRERLDKVKAEQRAFPCGR